MRPRVETVVGVSNHEHATTARNPLVGACPRCRARDHASSTIGLIAGEAGEFDKIRIGTVGDQADGRCEGNADYLPGFPGVFRHQLVE
jgi:hypothetical protein